MINSPTTRRHLTHEITELHTGEWLAVIIDTLPDGTKITITHTRRLERIDAEAWAQDQIEAIPDGYETDTDGQVFAVDQDGSRRLLIAPDRRY